jgi:hypothetical protein
MPVAASKAAMVDDWNSLFVLSSTIVISPEGALPGLSGASDVPPDAPLLAGSLALTQPLRATPPRASPLSESRRRRTGTAS